jgi:hypothetical protein
VLRVMVTHFRIEFPVLLVRDKQQAELETEILKIRFLSLGLCRQCTGSGSRLERKEDARSHGSETSYRSQRASLSNLRRVQHHIGRWLSSRTKGTMFVFV